MTRSWRSRPATGPESLAQAPDPARRDPLPSGAAPERLAGRAVELAAVIAVCCAAGAGAVRAGIPGRFGIPVVRAGVAGRQVVDLERAGFVPGAVRDTGPGFAVLVAGAVVLAVLLVVEVADIEVAGIEVVGIEVVGVRIIVEVAGVVREAVVLVALVLVLVPSWRSSIASWSSSSNRSSASVSPWVSAPAARANHSLASSSRPASSRASA